MEWEESWDVVVGKCCTAQTTDVHCSLSNLSMWQDPGKKWVEKCNDPNTKDGTAGDI